MPVGPLPRFAEVHVHRALELIAERGRIGRKELSRKLCVGEGSVRTILVQLKKRGLITSSRGGHVLTSKGRRVLGEPLEFIQLDAGGMTVGEIDIATIVRGAAAKVKKGIEQRDEAIKAGADGATVLVFRKGKLLFPDGFLKVEKKPTETLMKVFNPREGDVIIIGSARDAVKAEEGAKAAARTLL